MSDAPRILVPVDLSDGAQVALHYAGDLAARLGLGLEVLHAWEVPLYASAGLAIGLAGAGARHALDEMARAEADKGLQAILARASLPPEVTVTETIRYGDPAEMILEQAARTRPRLIVMATHGRHGVERFLLGSVTIKVMRRAPCPVLVVPIPHPPHASHEEASPTEETR